MTKEKIKFYSKVMKHEAPQISKQDDIWEMKASVRRFEVGPFRNMTAALIVRASGFPR